MRVRSPLARLAFALTTLAAIGLGTAELDAQGVNLDQLIKLAKDRATTQRPRLEKKLAPFREALESKYVDNWVQIEEKVTQVVKLGDSIVPLLLEHLEPRSSSPPELNLAENSARILGKMEPASFLQALIDIAQGESYVGRVHAIPLLGMTESSRAGEVLTQLLDGKATHHPAIISALARLEYKGAALNIAKLLPIRGRDLDQRAARYLETTGVAAVVPEVFRALEAVKLGSQIMRYVRVLRACAPQDARSADRLLSYFNNSKLDRSELTVLADTLAVVAPMGHKPTIARLKAILAEGDTGKLELRTAATLRKLGDKTGPAALRKNLLRRTRGRNKRSFVNHANLGDYYLEFGDYELAVKAYKAGINVATANAIRSMLYLRTARAQAHRQKWRFVRDALRDSKMPQKTLLTAAREHPELAEAMQHGPVKKFMAAFGK